MNFNISIGNLKWSNIIFRSLQDIYEVTKNQSDLALFCLFINCELVSFEETIQDKRWKNTIGEKIKAISMRIEISSKKERDN